jgi:hypothetical protein
MVVVVVASAVFSSVVFVYCSPDYSWASSIRDHDGDGYPDARDEFPSEPSQWSDIDGDGYGDNLSGTSPDHFRDDPTEWNDTDGDGVGDNSDAFPEDPDHWDLVTPAAVYQMATITNGQKITIVSITKADVPWDEVTVELSDGTNIASWTPTMAFQSTIAGHNYSTSTALTGLTVCLWVTDISGNGYVSGADFFTVFTYDGAPGFSSSTVYSAVLLYEPTGELCGTPITFTGTSTQTPTASYAKNTITNGQKITIVSISRLDVPWDDVKIQLSDGTNIAEWSPTKAFQSSTVGHNYSTSALLTGLTVCVWITDVSGNGYVSGTDYFTVFTYGGATGFSSSTMYTVVLLYEPTGERCGTPLAFTG